MKKILALILVAVLCLGMLASCVKPGTDVEQDQGNTPAGPSIEDAASYLHKIYKDKKETTMADFDVVAQVSINGVIFPVTWTCDNAAISIRESTKTGFYTVDLPDMITEEIVYTLTATISDANGNTTSKSYTFKAPVVDNSGTTTNPIEGVAYKLYLVQANLGKRYYALSTTQDNANKFINTTEDPKAGAEFFVEKVDGGYKVYTLVNDVKNYIYVNVTRTENEDGTVKYSKFIGFSTEEASVLTYKDTMGGTWTATVLDMVWGIGTYNSYTTISVSEGSYFTADKVGSSQFVMQFMTAEYANTLEKDEVESSNDAKAILEELYGLADGEQVAGAFTLTGKITALDNYGNPTIVVEGYENMPVYCYRLTDSRFVVDAVITVTAAQMKNYGGTYEFMSCTLDSITLPEGGEVTPPVDGGETSDSAVLDLMGNANLVSGSGEQNVFAANGITFTNDKASSTSALTVQASYAQRAYAGSTIKIEYPGMTQIVITFDDYSPDGTKNYMSGMDGMVVEGATFSRNNDVLTITFAAATNVFQSTNLTSQVRIEKIEVYTGEVENPGEGGGNDTPVVTPGYAAPVENQAYDLYMELPSSVVYFAGSLDAEKGTYLNTTADADASVEIFFEIVSGGYNIYFMNGDVKTYINAEAYLKSNGYAGCHFTLGETATTVWTYDTTNGVLEVYGEIEGKSDTFFAGTYGTYSTVSLSGAYYKGQIASGTQFPARIATADGTVIEPTPTPDPETPVDPNPDTPVVPEDGIYTIPQALAAAEGTAVTIKGTVCEIYQAWSDQYSNISFYIKDDAGNKILVFRTGTNAKIGDQVTVTGNVTLYNTSNQIAQGSTTVIDVVHVCSDFEPADCLNAASCVVCGAVSGNALGHNYVNGTCDRCNATEVSGTVTVSKTIAELITALGWTSSTTKQTFTLDDNVSIKIDGGSNTGKAYGGDHIRIYATDTPAGTITITVPEGYELVSVKISAQTGTYAFLCLDGSDADICNETISVSGNSVVLNSVKNGSDGKQVRVTAIEVVYAAVN